VPAVGRGRGAGGGRACGFAPLPGETLPLCGVGCAAATTIPDQWRAARLRSAAGLDPFKVPPRGVVSLARAALPARAGVVYTQTLSEADALV
jgi:hypothetical protein